MKNKFSATTARFYRQIIFIAVFISIFLCECQSNNKKVDPSVVEDKQSIRKIQVLSDNRRFQLDIRDIGENEGWYKNDFNRNNWAKVTVPQAWDCYETALWGYEGTGWYTTTINRS